MLSLKNKNVLSLRIFILLVVLMLVIRFFTPSWLNQNCQAIISWDVFGYYLYLPAWFIHHDLGIKDFGWVQQILDTYNPTIGFYQAYMGPAGGYVMKYPMGLAILYSPLFIVGHFAAHIFGYSPDGFTLPYQVSMAFGTVIYAFIGLWYFRKILLRFFSDRGTAITMLVVVMGTNYLELTAVDGAMPHNFLFTLFALIVWLTIKWHEDPRWKYAIPLGLLCGLVFLVRPTSAVIVLVPILWGFWNRSSISHKFSQIINNYPHVIIMIIGFFAVVFLQMIYWKIHAGTYLYFSYGKDDSLEWLAPYLGKVLFSYRKGWLVYTPVMIFALIGFYPLAKKYRSIFLAVFLFFIVNLLVIASWPAWWYAGSFSQRALMESYLLLAFPLGALMDWIFLKKRPINWIIFIVIGFLIVFNLFQTWQYTHNVIDASRMTREYYWRVFGKTSVTDVDRLYLMPFETIEDREVLPVTGKSINKVLAQYDFENADPDNQIIFCKDTANTGKYSMRLSKKNEFSPGINIPYDQLSLRDFAGVQMCGYIYFTCKPEEAGCAMVITCLQNGAAYKYRLIPLEKENLKPFVWNKV
ncbi:MAG: glycosyltransferase family 39 protein, partial [Bacteroidales bacterium]|nr:glycosyltransferase family 39 protein [Bacteroidales bacterium]